MTCKSGKLGQASRTSPETALTTSPSLLSKVGSSSQSLPICTNGVPPVNESSTPLAHAATNFGRWCAKLVEEATRDLGSNLVGTSEAFGLPSPVCHPCTESTENVGQAQQSSPSSSRDAAQTSLDITIASTVKRATSIISSTGLSLIGAGQNLLNQQSIMHGFMTRIQTTLRGSTEDIGWLQSKGLAPVQDKTARFTEILNFVGNGVHKLPNSLMYLLIPGLFSNHGPLYFVETKKYFSKLGLTCHIAKIHSEASTETNALELRNYIEELYWGSGKRVLLFGHSKGGVDAAAAVAMYWPDLKEKVAGMVITQSPYGGSPIASDILREGQIADLETKNILKFLVCNVLKGDIRSLEDLTYEKRREFLAKYPLPPEFPVVSFHTEASTSFSKFSVMSRIAYAELPWLSVPNSRATPENTTKLPVIIPLSAVMAACAMHLELRYGVKSDGVVVRKDAEVPGSIVVQPNEKLDHAWMVYSSSISQPNTLNSSQICEALITLLLEESGAAEKSDGID